MTIAGHRPLRHPADRGQHDGAVGARADRSEIGVLKTLGFTGRRRCWGSCSAESMLLSAGRRCDSDSSVIVIAAPRRCEPLVESLSAGLLRTARAACDLRLRQHRGAAGPGRRRRCPHGSAMRLAHRRRVAGSELTVRVLLQIACGDHGSTSRQHAASDSAPRSVAVFGFAGVVAVFVAVLSIAEGFQRGDGASAGSDENWRMVMRGGSDSEMTSGLAARPDVRLIKGGAGHRASRRAGFAGLGGAVRHRRRAEDRTTGTDAERPAAVASSRRRSGFGRRTCRSSKGRSFRSRPQRGDRGAGRSRAVRGHGPSAIGFAGARDTWEVVGVFSADRRLDLRSRRSGPTPGSCNPPTGAAAPSSRCTPAWRAPTSSAGSRTR